jgi:protocatechuate 3,4-dioxygenase beta subunit
MRAKGIVRGEEKQFEREATMTNKTRLRWTTILVFLCLTAHGQTAAPTNYVVRARIVGQDGEPVAGAVAEPDGVGTGSSTSWGGAQGFTNRVTSGTNGEFEIGRREPFTRLQLKIHSPGLATEHFWLPVTNTLQTINMGVGGAIKGRVMKDGQPFSGARIGFVGANRSSEVFAGHFDTVSDPEGIFVMEHLPTNTAWFVYGVFASLKSHGAVKPIPAATKGHGETNDIGDVPIIKGLRLTGQVKTRSGEPLPGGTRIVGSIENAWESQTVNVDAEGRFALEGLPKGLITLSMSQRDWRLASINRSLDLYGGHQLTGLLTEDKSDLLVVIEKGRMQPYGGSMGNGQLPPGDNPSARPLFGAEDSGPPLLPLAGQVLDDKTGLAIPAGKVTPGRIQAGATTAPPPQKNLLQQMLQPLARKSLLNGIMPYWQANSVENFANGHFALDFLPLTSQPVLRIEAEGYLPFETEPISPPATNLVIRLKQGVGPNGVVLLPNGRPAEKANLVFGAAREQLGLTARTLSAYGQTNATRITGTDGKFSFAPRSHGATVFVAHPDGWATESVEEGGDGLKVRLKPWAAMVGTLVDTNGVPMPGVQLAMAFDHDWSTGEPFVNIQGQTTTDAAGRFLFTNVPPSRIQINRVIPMTGAGMSGGWTSRLQTWLEVQPGKTNDLGKVTYDTPPPPRPMDRLKQKLGF